MRNKEYFKAYRYWLPRYKSLEADENVRPYLLIPSPKFKGGGLNRIHETREALLISVQELANRLNVSTAAVRGFEKREMEGALSLEKLRLVAEAMDCELVYAIRPKSKELFSQVIWKQLLPGAIEHWWVKTRPHERKAQALGWIARIQFEDPKFRRDQNWAKRKFR